MQKSSFAVLLISSAVAACGGDTMPEPESPQTETTGTTQPSGEAMTQAPATTPMEQPPPMTATAPNALTDPAIAAVMDAANDAEVQQADLAQQQAENARVRQFAEMMISDHSAAKRKQAALLEQLGMSPSPNAESVALANESMQTMQSLRMSQGAGFDRAYMDAQVDAHAKLLTKLDTQLIPSVDDSQFKALLMDLRPTIEAHLTEARSIQRELAALPEVGLH